MNSPHAERWLASLLSTEPIDHSAGEKLLSEFYAAAGMASPKYFLWHTSPLEALWSFGALSENQSDMTASFMQHIRQRSDTLAKLNQVRSELQTRLEAGSWQDAEAAVGAWQSVSAGFGKGNPAELLPAKITMARTGFLREVAGMDAYLKHLQQPDPTFTDLQAAERQVFGHFGDGILAYGAAYARAESLRQWMGRTIYNDYSYTDMARDQMFTQQHGATPPAIIDKLWQLAGTVGIWWPFKNAVILAERPVEIQHGAKGALTFIFSDGWKAEPYSPRTVPKTKAKAAAADDILSVELPRDGAARLELLRKRSPNLPLFDRYIAGEREEVWRELVELGADVRTPAHAADALAVAYEAMTRVEANIKTLVERLRALGYSFVAEPGQGQAMTGMFEQLSSLFKAAGVPPGMERMFEGLKTAGSRKKKLPEPEPHTGPSAATWKKLKKLEKTAGPLPLSLRAFYDLVGEVNFLGSHPTIAPAQSSVSPDPLVVYGLDDALAQLDSQDPEDDEFYLAIAPDDLHKANVSGGDPYSVRLPAPVADTMVESEAHGVNFVEYLRIVFAWGGFPGWENADAVAPPELAELTKGLIAI